MSEVVLDASALLALLRDEPGGDVVATHIGQAVRGGHLFTLRRPRPHRHG